MKNNVRSKSLESVIIKVNSDSIDQIYYVKHRRKICSSWTQLSVSYYYNCVSCEHLKNCCAVFELVNSLITNAMVRNNNYESEKIMYVFVMQC